MTTSETFMADEYLAFRSEARSNVYATAAWVGHHDDCNSADT